MNVFNNLQRSGYEEIASYSPRYYRSIKEMDAVFRLAGFLCDLMGADLEKTVASPFIDLMDDETFTRYEAFLGIEKDPNKTLEERKAYVNALLIGSGKISKDKIIAIVNQLAECECDIVLQDAELYINMTFKDNPDKYMDDIRGLIRDKVPAHIEIIYHGAEDLNIVVILENKVTVERIRNRTDFFLYSMGNMPLLDGSLFLDGDTLLGSMYDLFPARDCHRVEVKHNEYVEADTITVKKDLYFLDGSLTLNGQTKLDADEWKEDI